MFFLPEFLKIRFKKKKTPRIYVDVGINIINAKRNERLQKDDSQVVLFKMVIHNMEKNWGKL